MVTGIFFIKSRGGDVVDDETVPPIPLADRPQTSLTPTEDGHYLKLAVMGIKVAKAEALDYELLYKTADGITQGVPGSIKLQGQTDIERELLLGSESSGKFRYDDGVTEGKLTLRFRNSSGKLVGKLTTDFHMQTETAELSSLDNIFNYKLDDISNEFFITMETFGLPAQAGLPGPVPGNIANGPYGIFSSGKTNLSGQTNLTHFWDGSSWTELSGGKSSEIGIFVSLTSE